MPDKFWYLLRHVTVCRSCSAATDCTSQISAIEEHLIPLQPLIRLGHEGHRESQRWDAFKKVADMLCLTTAWSNAQHAEQSYIANLSPRETASFQLKRPKCSCHVIYVHKSRSNRRPSHMYLLEVQAAQQLIPASNVSWDKLAKLAA